MSARGPRYSAMVAGAARYTSDKPCSRGHVSPRITATGTCVECKQLCERTRVANARTAYNDRKRRERQPVLPVLAARARLARSLESVEQRSVRLSVARQRSALWRLVNPQHVGGKEAKRRYAESTRGKAVAASNVAKRRAAFMQRIPSWLTADDYWLIREIYHLAKIRSTITGSVWHVDHIIPLQGKLVSGLHVAHNLQVITKLSNIRKGNKYDVDNGGSPI